MASVADTALNHHSLTHSLAYPLSPMRWSEGASGVQDREDIQAANLAGFHASKDPRFYERNPKFFNTF